MMKSRSLLNGMVATGVALAMVSTLAAQTVAQASATVARIKGSARYKIGSNDWQPLKRGDVSGRAPLSKPGAMIPMLTSPWAKEALCPPCVQPPATC